jgi:predicted small metal-binding protein
MNPDVDGWSVEMHQFQCGHMECFSQFTASNKDDLMRQVAEHLKDVHNVDRATEALMSYLESTCVTTRKP